MEKQKLQIYIAAPFTIFATNERENSDLFNTEEYGIIPDFYKNILQDIESYFKKIGLDTFLPHRDVNNWGKTPLSSKEVFDNISLKVKECDIVFAIPAKSIGVHLEVGIAISLGKKIVICDVEELNGSFFIEGMSVSKEIYTIKCDKLSDIVEQLKINKIINYINSR